MRFLAQNIGQTMSTVGSTKPSQNKPSGFFHPCRWGDHIFNLCRLPEETQAQIEEEIRELKEGVITELLGKCKRPEDQIELIDIIERLGLAYHFEKEIEEALQILHQMQYEQEDLCHVSIRFRILRQHGFRVSSDIFKKYKDENGDFKGEVEGLLNLYEASYVRTHEDKILDEAVEFTTAYLKSMVKNLRSPLAERVIHALDQPLHKGMPRIEARHHILVYERDPSHNKALLRFAKLDFNMLQSMHQQELIEVTQWWKNVHPKVAYAKDRSMEAYFWGIGTYYEPRFSLGRKLLAKIVLITQVLDDMYDAYAGVQALDLLTRAIQRWQYSCLDDLPEDIRGCYQVVLETFEEFERDLAKEGTSSYVDYLRKQTKWNCEAWFLEAIWCHKKYIPTYDEYIRNGIVSIGHPMGISGAILGMGKMASKEAFEWACQTPMLKVVMATGIIVRIMNDIGGHKFEQSTRDHVASSVECYMKQHGIEDEKQTYEELDKKVEDAWKDLNEGMLRPYQVPKRFLDRNLNLSRNADVMYKYRNDGYTLVSDILMKKVASFMVQPIPL